MSSAVSVLVLGGLGAGKTLLVRQLKHATEHDGAVSAALETSSTTGVEVDKLCIPAPSGGSTAAVTLREYVLDVSQHMAVSMAAAELLELLAHPDVDTKPLLLVLNKTDMPFGMPPREVRAVLRLDDLTAAVRKTREFAVVEASARTGSGVPDVLAWLATTRPT